MAAQTLVLSDCQVGQSAIRKARPPEFQAEGFSVFFVELGTIPNTTILLSFFSSNSLLFFFVDS